MFHSDYHTSEADRNTSIPSSSEQKHHVRTHRGGASVQLPPSVVGHDDALNAVLHSQLSVLLGQDALDDDREAGDGLQPGDVLPADGRVQGVGRYPILLWGTGFLLCMKNKTFIGLPMQTWVSSFCLFFVMQNNQTGVSRREQNDV